MSPGNISASFAPLMINGQQLNGGFSFNYNLPNMGAVTQNAYNFMSANNAQDFGFVGQTISGSQNFLQNQVAPILSGAVNQINANPQFINTSLGMETQLANTQMGYMAALQQSSIAAQQAVAQASIQSSTASAQAASKSGGGGCFITTAVCEFENLPDDCETLTILRGFRDGYVKKHYPELIASYYQIAPKLVAQLERKKAKEGIYEALRVIYLERCIVMIQNGEYEKAVNHYRSMVEFVRALCDE